MSRHSTGLQPLNLIMTLVSFLVSSIVVGVRVWKRLQKGSFASDDLLIVIAQILAIGLTVATCTFIKVSYTGYRFEDIPLGALNKIEASKWKFIIAVLYNPILALIKVSFIITLIKLQAPNIWIKSSLWTLLAVNVLFGIAGTLVALLNCRPIPKFWDRTIPGSCMNTAQYIFGTISVTIITDALVSIIPAAILIWLHMPRKTKVLIISFLSLGLVVTAIASYRLSVFVRVFSVDDPLQNESPYNVRTPLSNIEASLAAIAACGPTLKYILGLVIPILGSSRTKPRSTTPHLNIANPDQPRSKMDEPTRNAHDTLIELSDTLELPKRTADNTMADGNGSTKTVSLFLADGSLKMSSEEPRSLV